MAIHFSAKTTGICLGLATAVILGAQQPQENERRHNRGEQGQQQQNNRQQQAQPAQQQPQQHQRQAPAPQQPPAAPQARPQGQPSGEGGGRRQGGYTPGGATRQPQNQPVQPQSTPAQPGGNTRPQGTYQPGTGTRPQGTYQPGTGTRPQGTYQPGTNQPGSGTNTRPQGAPANNPGTYQPGTGTRPQGAPANNPGTYQPGTGTRPQGAPANNPGTYQPGTGTRPQGGYPPAGGSRPQNTPGTYQPGTGRSGVSDPGMGRQPNATPRSMDNRPRDGNGRGGTTIINNNTTIIRTNRGDSVYRRPDGRVTEVRTSRGQIIRDTGGFRRVEVARGDRVIVSNRAGMGFVQRPVVVRNRDFVQRTYVYRGRPYVAMYRPYRWAGVPLNVYTPVRYYSPGFYAWVGSPWGRPVHYNWWWSRDPWYGYYRGYFTPYPYYTSPAMWLTDYLIATELERAYQERMAMQANPQPMYMGGVALTPDVKQAISDEVARQMRQESADRSMAASNNFIGAPPESGTFLDGASHVFLVATPLEVADGGSGCALTEGDVLQLNGPVQQGAPAASLMVLASKGNDCRRGAMVTVAVQDLQEMQNQMRATVDQGLQELQARQGQAGLPQLPANAAQAPIEPFAGAIQADPNAASELRTEFQEADRAEQDVVSQALNQPAQSGTVTLQVGMTMNEVVASQGQPEKVVNLGSKVIYVYRDIKITFTDGRVSDVQ